MMEPLRRKAPLNQAPFAELSLLPRLGMSRATLAPPWRHPLPPSLMAALSYGRPLLWPPSRRRPAGLLLPPGAALGNGNPATENRFPPGKPARAETEVSWAGMAAREACMACKHGLVCAGSKRLRACLLGTGRETRDATQA
jgi:hypothetical protein